MLQFQRSREDGELECATTRETFRQGKINSGVYILALPDGEVVGHEETVVVDILVLVDTVFEHDV